MKSGATTSHNFRYQINLIGFEPTIICIIIAAAFIKSNGKKQIRSVMRMKNRFDENKYMRVQKAKSVR